MAIQTFRYQLQYPNIEQDRLRSVVGNTATLGAFSSGQIQDIDFEETLIDDLDEKMAELGFVRIEGPGVVGTPASANPYLPKAGGTMTGAINMGGNRIQSVPDVPVALTDAVNANYVQNEINALDPKDSVRASTTASLIAAGWTPSGSGVGKTLTSPNDALANNQFDGVTLVLGDRLFVLDETGADRVHNGIYTLTTPADGAGQAAILTRAIDADQNAEVTQGLRSFITEGTTRARIAYILTTQDPIVVDTTELAFSQHIAADNVQAGVGLLRTGNVIDMEFDTDADETSAGSGGGSSGLETDIAGAGGQARVKVDPTSMRRVAAGIAARLNATGALEATATGLATRVDGTSVQIVGNQLTAPGGGADTQLWGAGSVNASTATRYLFPGFDASIVQADAVQIRAARAGVYRNLRVRQNQASGNGNAIVYTLRVNGSASALAVSMASTATDGSDLVNTVSVAAGDLIDIQITKAASVGSGPNDVVATVEFRAV